MHLTATIEDDDYRLWAECCSTAAACDDVETESLRQGCGAVLFLIICTIA